MSKMICVDCGRETKKINEFCQFCGGKLKETMMTAEDRDDKYTELRIQNKEVFDFMRKDYLDLDIPFPFNTKYGGGIAGVADRLLELADMVEELGRADEAESMRKRAVAITGGKKIGIFELIIGTAGLLFLIYTILNRFR
jgi:hypothetical protein